MKTLEKMTHNRESEALVTYSKQKNYIRFIRQEFNQLGIQSHDKSLETEAESIMSILPKMTPGKQRDRNFGVPYSIPINFKLKLIKILFNNNMPCL